MVKKLILATVLMLSIALVGCSSKNSATNTKTEDNTVVENSTTDNNENDIKKDTPTESSKDEKNDNKKETEAFSIYTEDANSMEIKEISTIELNKNLSLEDKLKQLSKTLSEKVFDKLPIEVKSIETIDGKKIATINLDESAANKGVTSNADLKKPNWTADKLQGSTGGEITENSLLETFLQVKYKGEWIDGVKFLYKNEPIEFEHTPNLSQINYRK
ncbi:hypothetical protein SR42_10235 [Clostridium botulinum]|uniref:hypothetical protein n=1 Tax=Clostridium botulinum TaxID=1491 RepID=UPI000596C8D8|nr:hypothetical protein [Clostridium botulinum]KIL09332.1 hypothetical protein SR42_10235 [Clostridium botulinum]MBY6933035.1 hypothetical protein [Clostridium botulinum]NFL84405.1 hypothetical protein [Clostridium botulinum]NFN10687.1 hypothetical protein [Clostridium botulinum]NFO37054.1 hypothetical protein [Clostridium botulinum]